MQYKYLSAYLALIFACLFWGGNYITGRYLADQIAPFLLSFLRWFPCCIILLLGFSKKTTQYLPVIKQNFLLLLTFAFLGVVLFPTSLYIGLQSTSAINAALYLSSVPVMIVFFNWLIFKKPVKAKNGFGILLSLFGVALLISKNFSTHIVFESGDIYAFISALSWAFYCLLLPKKPNLPLSVFLTITVFFGTLLLLPFTFYQLTLSFSNEQLIGIGYLVLGPSLASYWLWSYGVSKIGSAKSAPFNHLIPLFSVILAIVLLSESVHGYQITSATLIMLGVFLGSRN